MEGRPRPPRRRPPTDAQRRQWIRQAYLAYHGRRLDGAALRRVLEQLRRAT